MTRTEAIKAAVKTLHVDATDNEVALEAMRLMGIDVEALHHGELIRDHCLSTRLYRGPMDYLKWHVTTSRESHAGKAFFHF